MFHHDDRGYEEAASAAAAKGRVKMEEIVHAGTANAEAVVASIMSRAITDRVARTDKVRLGYDEDGRALVQLYGATLDSYLLHPHGYSQLLGAVSKSGKDGHEKGAKKFTDGVLHEAKGAQWGRDLVAMNVNTILAHRDKTRNLVRIEGGSADGSGGTVKGFLSDSFRRLDSRPLVDAFIGSCREVGLLPIDGVASDTKCRVRAVLPKVFEPTDNEVMLFGAEFGNSDYGDGGLVINMFTMRVWCTNLAVTEKCLRTVHLGARLPDDLTLSARTYELDAKTTASAVRDITSDVIGPARVNRMLAAIRDADSRVIRSRDGIDALLARSLDKGEVTQVKQIYESPDVTNLPAGETMWRLSNAVSWFAQGRNVGADRKMELQTVAGSLIGAKQGSVEEV